jgi:hypothetical protein
MIRAILAPRARARLHAHAREGLDPLAAACASGRFLVRRVGTIEKPHREDGESVSTFDERKSGRDPMAVAPEQCGARSTTALREKLTLHQAPTRIKLRFPAFHGAGSAVGSIAGSVVARKGVVSPSMPGPS